MDKDLTTYATSMHLRFTGELGRGGHGVLLHAAGTGAPGPAAYCHRCGVPLPYEAHAFVRFSDNAEGADHQAEFFCQRCAAL